MSATTTTTNKKKATGKKHVVKARILSAPVQLVDDIIPVGKIGTIKTARFPYQEIIPDFAQCEENKDICKIAFNSLLPDNSNHHTLDHPRVGRRQNLNSDAIPDNTLTWYTPHRKMAVYGPKDHCIYFSRHLYEVQPMPKEICEVATLIEQTIDNPNFNTLQKINMCRVDYYDSLTEARMKPGMHSKIPLAVLVLGASREMFLPAKLSPDSLGLFDLKNINSTCEVPLMSSKTAKVRKAEGESSKGVTAKGESSKGGSSKGELGTPFELPPFAETHYTVVLSFFHQTPKEAEEMRVQAAEEKAKFTPEEWKGHEYIRKSTKVKRKAPVKVKGKHGKITIK